MLLGQLPNNIGTKTNTADFVYKKSDQHRLWQVWIETSKDDPSFELEIKYPPGTFQNPKSLRGYMFKIALGLTTRDADNVNNISSGEIKGDIVLSQQSTQILSLAIPNWVIK